MWSCSHSAIGTEDQGLEDTSVVARINSTSSSSYWCGIVCSAQQGMTTDVCSYCWNDCVFSWVFCGITNTVTLHCGETPTGGCVQALLWEHCGFATTSERLLSHDSTATILLTSSYTCVSQMVSVILFLEGIQVRAASLAHGRSGLALPVILCYISVKSLSLHSPKHNYFKKECTSKLKNDFQN